MRHQDWDLISLSVFSNYKLPPTRVEITIVIYLELAFKSLPFIFAQLSDAERARMVDAGTSEASIISNSTEPKNIFFLKTSKTGSTTMMSVFQRYGLKHRMNFLLGTCYHA